MSTRAKKFRTFLTDNGLSLFMFGLFALFLIGLSITGSMQHNDELRSHGQLAQSYGSYLTSGAFVEAVFENWESEFLQMAALVVATVFLRQKGAADSNKFSEKRGQSSATPHVVIGASHGAQKKSTLGGMLYANSLGLALFTLFGLSFTLHALGGVSAHNQEAMLHGEASVSTMQYVLGSQFWFESFQNWQSEFLSVGTLLVFSIFLRQRGSPESKSMTETNQETGN